MRLHPSVLLTNQMFLPANPCYAVCSPEENDTLHLSQWKSDFHFSEQTVIAIHPDFCLICLWPLIQIYFMRVSFIPARWYRYHTLPSHFLDEINSSIVVKHHVVVNKTSASASADNVHHLK